MTRCVASSGDRVCFFIEGHPTTVHVDLSSGWHRPWSEYIHEWVNVLAVPPDALQDAPEALK